MFDCPIYPITDARAEMSLQQQVASFVRAGATVVQLRAKHLNSRELYDAAMSLGEIVKDTRTTLLVNDRVDIALAADSHGVHLGQDDLHPSDAREILGPNAVIGFSTHNLEQIAEAARLPLDYIAFGPVFETSTKENPDPVVGTDLLVKAVAAAGSIPVVAIGGIGPENVSEIAPAGASAAAVIGSLFSAEGTIVERFHLLAECW